MKSKGFKIVFCGLSILIFSNWTLAQSEKEPALVFKYPSHSSLGFADFIKDKITFSKSTKTSTLFIVFKLNAEGKISDIKLSDEISLLLEKELKAAIIESETSWITNFKSSEMKWVVLPIFLGKYIYPNPLDNSFKGKDYFISMENQFKWLHSTLGTNLNDIYFSAPLIQ